MTSMKIALLAGVAVATTAVSAQADDLTALKAQIESLSARVATMEAAPTVPAGYSLVSFQRGEQGFAPDLAADQKNLSKNAHIISVVPTADAPAGAEISWSGNVRAAIVYDSFDNDFAGDGDNDDDLGVYSRAQLIVNAKTDTAVGEVGVSMDIRQHWRDRSAPWNDESTAAFFDSAWGYWQMTPELTLGGGKAGTIGNIGYGVDGACTCMYTDNADIYMDPGGRSQMRLTYASGPMSFAVSVEDGDANTGATAQGWNSLAYAAELKWTGDSMNAELAGWYLNEDDYQFGGGVGFGVDMFALSIGAAIGTLASDEYWVVSGLASFNFSDEIHAELGAGYKDYDVSGSITSVMGGIYYMPVDQLTIGVEAEWFDDEALPNDAMTIALVSQFSF